MADNVGALVANDDSSKSGNALKRSKAVKRATPKKAAKSKRRKRKATKTVASKAIKDAPKDRAKRVERPFPRVELQEAIKVPMAIRLKNGGNPWTPDQVAEAVGYGKGTNSFFYLTAAARDFGLTEGTRDTPEISLTELGRSLAYAETPEEEHVTRREAFFRIPLFREVLDYYKGSALPEMKYLQNTLENKFGLHPSIHEEFANLFRKNCEYLQITEGGSETDAGRKEVPAKKADVRVAAHQDLVTVAEPEEDTGLVCFVAMPFSERYDEHSNGFFAEVLKQIIAPAGRSAGFRVVTARKQGSDVIQATIVNGLLDADLVIVDLTEHNPNVLFELGMRMAEDKPVVLLRAKGTKAIFDVDNMLRVEEYSPNLWPSTVEADMPKIEAHIRGTWSDRNNAMTYMKILRNKATAKP